jgi:hypothetical protein
MSSLQLSSIPYKKAENEVVNIPQPLSLSLTFIEALDPSKRIIVMGSISQLLSLGQTFGKTIILSMFKVQTTRPFDCDM